MSEITARSTRLVSGDWVPALGQGTWCMGDERDRGSEEIRALQLGIDLGMTLIDTAEMYGDGASEELVGEAIAGRRDEVFLVSKVLPGNASRAGTIAACERSLRRLRTDRIDLYLLHWRGGVPLSETLAGFEALARQGKIRHWGVSNFDLADMEELLGLPGGASVQTNQVLFNLSRRGIEFDLLPWSRARAVPVMAYSPIEQGRLLARRELRDIAARHVALRRRSPSPGCSGRRESSPSRRPRAPSMSGRTMPRSTSIFRGRTWPRSSAPFRPPPGNARSRCCRTGHAERRLTRLSRISACGRACANRPCKRSGQKIRIALEWLRGEQSIAEPCPRDSIDSLAHPKRA